MEEIVTVVTQLGIVPAICLYLLVVVKKSIDNNTLIVTKLYERMGGKIDE